jgi:sugar-specific transcriptional regulator TrmB
VSNRLLFRRGIPVESENELRTMSHLKEVLSSIGIAERAAAIYIYLLKKRTPQTANDITKFMKKNKALVYRNLKHLQADGFIVSTMGFPTRFTAIPLRDVLDHAAKSKRREAQLLTKEKRILCNVIESLEVADTPLKQEEFAILRGENIAVLKGRELAKQTKSEFLIIGDKPALHTIQVIEEFPLMIKAVKKRKARFRFITNLDNDGLNVIKELVGKLDMDSEYVEIRHLVLDPGFFPGFALSDENAMIFKFDAYNWIDSNSASRTDSLLWTNNKALIRSEKLLYNKLWDESIDIRKRIAELENGVKH